METVSTNGTIEWSDERCTNIASLDNFPAAIRDIGVQKNVINQYLNFYLGGRIQKGLCAIDLVLAAIAVMPISSESEEFIWDNSEYSENGHLFFFTPDDKLKYDINCVLKKTVSATKPNTDVDNLIYKSVDDTDVNIGSIDCKSDSSSHIPPSTKMMPLVHTKNLQWYRLKSNSTSNRVPNAVEIKYGPVENAQFCIYFNKLLDKWETSVKARITIKYFFAMVSLTILRSKAKTLQTIIRYFSNKLIDKNNYVQDILLECYTIPNRLFVKKCWKAVRDDDVRIPIMFSKLVMTSLEHTERLSHHEKFNIIKFAVLSHTAYHAMGLIKILQQFVNCSYADTFAVFIKTTYSDETAASWNRVNDFFKKYMIIEAKQHTFHWAGAIERDAFKHLSCSNNYELAVVIAVFVEKMTENSGIWQSEWVGKGKNLGNCKQLGYKMYEEYQTQVTLDIDDLLSCGTST